jgi:hypothetical protein
MWLSTEAHDQLGARGETGRGGATSSWFGSRDVIQGLTIHKSWRGSDDRKTPPRYSAW